MAAVRENILTDTVARDKFLEGVVSLDNTSSGFTAQDAFEFLSRAVPNLQMAGINQELSIYDLFVLWHVVAMSIPLPPGNAAIADQSFYPGTACT